MKALRILADIRKRGVKPEAVIIELGSSDHRDWWAVDAPVVSIAIPDDYSLRGLDFRVFVGVDTIVTCKAATERSRAIVARLCGHAASVTVLIGSNPENLGHVWERGSGWRAFGDGAIRRAA